MKMSSSPAAAPQTFACFTLMVSALLAACSGGPKGPSKASETDAEIGKSLQAEGWQVTLNGLSEKVKVVGQGSGQGGGTYSAQGIFVAVPVKLANLGQAMQLLPATGLFLLQDDQAREFELAEQRVQIAYVRDLPGIREAINVTPLAAGETKEGFLVFDVPEDARALKLILNGGQGSINLGFSPP